MRIDPFEALTEYLSLQFGVRSLVELVVGNTGFRQLMNAAPGWRELITLGKIWHLAQLDAERSESTGRAAASAEAGSGLGGDPGGTGSRRRFDFIVVDAPASGHGVAFLEVPRVVVSAVRAGPLRAHTERVEEMIEDPEQTLVLPVSLAEELPAREVTEMVKRVRGEMGLSIDRVVVNGVVSPPFANSVEELDRALSRIDGDLDLGDLPKPETLAWCARYLRSRYELNSAYTAQIQRTTELPVVLLPRISEGIHDLRPIEMLGQILLAEAGDPL
jgi:anion-transporting  ArsA/GET3 family ATPase